LQKRRMILSILLTKATPYTHIPTHVYLDIGTSVSLQHQRKSVRVSVYTNRERVYVYLSWYRTHIYRCRYVYLCPSCTKIHVRLDIGTSVFVLQQRESVRVYVYTSRESVRVSLSLFLLYRDTRTHIYRYRYVYLCPSCTKIHVHLGTVFLELLRVHKDRLELS